MRKKMIHLRSGRFPMVNGTNNMHACGRHWFGRPLCSQKKTKIANLGVLDRKKKSTDGPVSLLQISVI